VAVWAIDLLFREKPYNTDFIRGNKMQDSTQLIYNSSLMNEGDTETDVWSAPSSAPTIVRGITQPKVLELLDLRPRKLTRWKQEGLFLASILQSNGGRLQGGEHCKTIYSYTDWLGISLVAHLRKNHVGMSTVKASLVFLRKHNYFFDPELDCVYVIGNVVFTNYVNVEFHDSDSLKYSKINGGRVPFFVEWGRIRIKADDEFSQYSIQV
jgi:hypothetical protein